MAQLHLPARLIYSGFLIALVAIRTPALGEPTQFPGSESQLVSPNGDFILLDEDQDAEPYHSLYLRRSKTVYKQKIIDFDRSVTVEWSPDSSKYFINDNKLSDESVCNVESVYGFLKIDVMTLAELTFGVTGGMAGSHLYVICKAWKNDLIIDGVVEGYDGPNSATIQQPFELNVQSIRLHKK